MTKLYDVPRGSFIRIENTILHFHYLDGMYSYCTTEDGGIVHLSASAEVEIIPKPRNWREDETNQTI